MNKEELLKEIVKLADESLLKFMRTAESYYNGRENAYHKAKELVLELEETNKTEGESVVVSQKQARWLDLNLTGNKQRIIWESYKEFFAGNKNTIPFNLNLKPDGDLFNKAVWYGYEAKKEPLYRVELPIVTWNEEASELGDGKSYLKLDLTSDEVIVSSAKGKFKNWSDTLTEQQIKSIDKRYWQFAEPVEE